tara:strand:- start:1302 stop:1517 length:216 start_codon:yes stop_codon:yes gene_type:complete
MRSTNWRSAVPENHYASPVIWFLANDQKGPAEERGHKSASHHHVSMKFVEKGEEEKLPGSGFIGTNSLAAA